MINNKLINQLLFIPFFIISLAYSAIMKIRAYFYSKHLFKTTSLKARVISVGNLTLGGTGKTPIVHYLAESLRDKGKKVAILSRGYGGRSKEKITIVSDGMKSVTLYPEANDENAMLSSSLSGIVIASGKNRSKVGTYIEQKYTPDVIILDDGFQHLSLKRNQNIVVIDATNPFGNGYVFPLGCLRESLSALRRADMAWLTKVNLVSKERVDEIREVLLKYHSELPIVTSGYVPDSVYELKSKKNFSTNESTPIICVSSIGNPDSFVKSVEGTKMNVVGALSFPDHYHYKVNDIGKIKKFLNFKKCITVVTTEKDAIKLEQFESLPFECWVLRMKLTVSNA